jgi:hypothetical protein
VLTLDKLRTYEAYAGDLDGWARSKGAARGEPMDDEDWYLLDELLLGLTSVASGRASESFANHLRQRIAASTADESVAAALRDLASRLGRVA